MTMSAGRMTMGPCRMTMSAGRVTTGSLPDDDERRRGADGCRPDDDGALPWDDGLGSMMSGSWVVRGERLQPTQDACQDRQLRTRWESAVRIIRKSSCVRWSPLPIEKSALHRGDEVSRPATGDCRTCQRGTM